MIEFSRKTLMYLLFNECDKNELYKKQCWLVVDVLQLQSTLSVLTPKVLLPFESAGHKFLTCWSILDGSSATEFVICSSLKLSESQNYCYLCL